MIHGNRKFKVHIYKDLKNLAAKLKHSTFTLCTGFELEEQKEDGSSSKWFLLNDSFSEDGAQEYAVVKADDLIQYDSITVSWMGSTFDVLRALESIVKGERSEPMYGEPVPLSRHEEGTCHFCA